MGSVHGERLWYALHGHDVGPLRTRRGSVGHGRVLPPEARSEATARPQARLLVVKAARRRRREGWYARRGPRLEPVVPVRKQAFVGGLV